MTGFIRQTLNELFREIPVQILEKTMLTDVEITGIAYDSRAVTPGCLFVALEGSQTDGHRFISAAIERGAVAVVGTKAVVDLPVPYIRVKNGRFALAHISAAFYQFPGRNLSMVGVTGTDGKTTTTNLIYAILVEAGFRAGMISTLSAVVGDQTFDTGFHVTTPEAPEVQRYLSRMLAAGLSHVVLEVTSHGLAQHRITACEFDVGVITNITHEHLDFHETFEAYREVKAQLLTDLEKTAGKSQGNIRLAVLNKDDPSFDFLSGATSVRKVSYGIEADRLDIRAENIRFSPDGSHFDVIGQDFRFHVFSRLMGPFNVMNCLAAAATGIFAFHLSPEVIQRGIQKVKSIPGRMEQIAMGQEFIAMVDFAHTPNALRVVLEATRQLVSGRILVVFGSAGLRDREKRHMMAEVAVDLADLVFLTAEDPRTESLDDILEEMANAAHATGAEEGTHFWRIRDRGAAIREAIRLAEPGDIVITCGKGHEQSMCFGETEYPWDDRTAMKAAIAELLGKSGPKIPYLPTQEGTSNEEDKQ
jgi:UDP-N-acetylmuramoyl-L-alanyl-D-glutamate--2,6-diaminopimelate ligase